MRTQPRTMLTRISGCYAVTLYGQTKHFMLIDNLFDPSLFAEGKPNEKYDLKGSWVDRHSSPAESTRKDSDWTVTRKLRVSADNRRRLLRQAQNDARFLCGCKLMDYSLLLGICKDCSGHTATTVVTATSDGAETAHVVSKWETDFGGLRARQTDGSSRSEVYFFGIIDILQEYDIKKKLEQRNEELRTKAGVQEEDD